MRSELRVRRAGGENRADHSEIIEDLECARLDAFAARTLEGRRGSFDQTKRDPAAREIKGQGQSCRPSSSNQYIVIVHRTNQSIMVRCTNVKSKITIDPRKNRRRRTRHRRQGRLCRRCRCGAWPKSSNVGTMSLYYYVKTKDDLIAVMDDALMGEALLPSVPKGWQRAMTAIAKRTHAVFIRHPWALAAMLSAPPGLNAMRHMEQCLEALAETSMTKKQKLTLLAIVDDFVFGHALREAATDAPIDIEFAAAQLATGAFPGLRRYSAAAASKQNKAASTKVYSRY